MNITINTKKFTVTDALKTRIEKKLVKLDRYFQADTDATVKLSTERDLERIEITVFYHGMIFRAQEATGDMFQSLDGAVDSLERQLRKNKTRLEKRLKEGAFVEAYTDTVAEEPIELIRVKEFAVKPMDVEDAILQMNLLGHQFYVFRDLKSEKIRVVYRRNDGGYGLIAPIEDR